MTTLTINGKEFEAKCNFLFDRTADQKYKKVEVDEKKQKTETNGFSVIYSGLLDKSYDSLVQFWDCALEHYRDAKPTLDEIEEALEVVIDDKGDTLPLLQEAFNALHQAGFFKQPIKKHWKNVNLMKEIGGKDEEEMKQIEIATKMMEEAKEELLVSAG